MASPTPFQRCFLSTRTKSSKFLDDVPLRSRVPSPLRLLLRCSGAATETCAVLPPRPCATRRSQKCGTARSVTLPPLGVCFKRVIKQIRRNLLHLLVTNRNVGMDGSKLASSLTPLAFETPPTSVWIVHRDNLAIVLSKLQHQFPALQRRVVQEHGTRRTRRSQLSFDSSRMSCCLSVNRPSEPASSRS